MLQALQRAAESAPETFHWLRAQQHSLADPRTSQAQVGTSNSLSAATAATGAAEKPKAATSLGVQHEMEVLAQHAVEGVSEACLMVSYQGPCRLWSRVVEPGAVLSRT
jgi:hypothetical protein